MSFDIGQKVKILLATRNMTRQEVAELYDPPISGQTFGRKMNTNNFTTRDLEQICRILDVSCNVIFTLNDTGKEV